MQLRKYSRKLRKRLRLIPEVVLVIVARGVIPLLSRAAVLWLSRVLGLCAYYFSPNLRRVSTANLDLAFGDTKTPEEKQEICKASCKSFALVMLDLFWFGRRSHERLRQYVRYDGSLSAFFDDPPAVLVTAHIGNWEIIGIGCAAEGFPLRSIALPLKNAFADRAVNRLRMKLGSEVVGRDGGIRKVIKALRAGMGTLIAMDQNTLPEEGGVFVPFFGVPATVSKAGGTLWSRAEVSILACWCIPDDDGIYTVSGERLVGKDDALTAEEITVKITAKLEEVIRENPEYWLWSYKRWRFYRDEDDANQFPFYAQSYEKYSAHLADKKKARMLSSQ
jgi:KDO2-lipid IV(A) lauroyltransferase